MGRTRLAATPHRSHPQQPGRGHHLPRRCRRRPHGRRYQHRHVGRCPRSRPKHRENQGAVRRQLGRDHIHPQADPRPGSARGNRLRTGAPPQHHGGRPAPCEGLSQLQRHRRQHQLRQSPLSDHAPHLPGAGNTCRGRRLQRRHQPVRSQQGRGLPGRPHAAPAQHEIRDRRRGLPSGPWLSDIRHPSLLPVAPARRLRLVPGRHRARQGVRGPHGTRPGQSNGEGNAHTHRQRRRR